MGEIIIKVPGDIRETFEIKSELKIKELFKFLKESKKTDRKAILEEVLGIWSDKYQDKNPEEVGKIIRKESWRR